MGWQVAALVISTALYGTAAASQRHTSEPDAIAEPLVAGGGDPEEGRRIFVDRESGHCVLCHQVAGLDAPFQGDLGPALTGVGARLSSGQIRLRIVDSSRVNPATIMPPYHRTRQLERVGKAYQGQPVLTVTEVEHLVAWLASLNEE